MPDPTAADPIEDPRTILSLTTEHASLSAARALAWNESFSRTATFFTSLSAAGVAMALVGQATAFGGAFAPFVLVAGVAATIAYGRRTFLAVVRRIAAMEAATPRR